MCGAKPLKSEISEKQTIFTAFTVLIYNMQYYISKNLNLYHVLLVLIRKKKCYNPP